MPLTNTPPVLFESDEDIFIASGADFGVIAPKSNLLAYGADGAFAPGAPWVLTSATNDFAAQGVVPGMVVELAGLKPFTPPQHLAVVSASGGSLTLRRCGMAAGVGLPPGTAAGLTGATFRVVTFLPQTAFVADEIDRQFAIDPKVPNRDPLSLYDPDALRRLAVLETLRRAYLDANSTKEGVFADKVARYQSEHDRVRDETVVKWGTTGETQPPATRFSCRVSR